MHTKINFEKDFDWKLSSYKFRNEIIEEWN